MPMMGLLQLVAGIVMRPSREDIQGCGSPCGCLFRFARLTATRDGKPDGLENEIPSIFMKQMDPAELARKYGSFGVLNRPHTMVMLVNDPELMARFQEEYIFIAETDHVLFKVFFQR